MAYFTPFIFLFLLSPLCMGASIGVPEGMVENIIKLEQNTVSGQFGVLANCIEAKSNIVFKWQIYPTRRLFTMVESNEIDIVYPMGMTQQRNEIATPSKPLYSSERFWVYMGKKPDFNDKTLSIAVKRGSSQEDSLNKLGYSNLTLVKYDAILSMLDLKRVDAVLLPKEILTDLVNASQHYQTQLLSKRDIVFYLSYNFAQKNLAVINQAIDDCLPLKAD